MSKFNAGQSFADGDTVTGAKLNNIAGLLDIYTGLISEQTAMSATVSTADQLLIADVDNGDSGAANRVTVQKLLNDTLTNGTYTNAQLSGNLNVAQLSTLGTISSTTGTIQTLTSGTANISQGSAIFTQGTIATLNSTTGTIATLNSTTPTFLGAITASTNTINVGSGQIYKDASGKVLIGTTSNDTGGRLEVKQASSETGIGIQSSGTDDSKLYFRTASGTYGGNILFNGSYVKFSAGTTEAMRIDSSGNLLVGTTTAIGKLSVEAAGGGASTTPITTNSITGAGTRFAAGFYYSGAKVGGIEVTASATSYVTSSDYRLKTNLESISNGIERVKQLPVYRFNWIADQSGNKVDGFVAHEAKQIIPECVSGEKDAVDADGKPIYQGIDQSKIVPLLTAALKEAIAKIETLEAKVTALEAA